LVNISAGPITRRWQTTKYVEVIAHLRRRLPDAQIFVTGAPNEQDRIDAVASGSGASRAATASLMEVFALVATADLVCTPDTRVAEQLRGVERRVFGGGDHQTRSVALRSNEENARMLQCILRHHAENLRRAGRLDDLQPRRALRRGSNQLSDLVRRQLLLERSS